MKSQLVLTDSHDKLKQFGHVTAKFCFYNYTNHKPRIFSTCIHILKLNW